MKVSKEKRDEIRRSLVSAAVELFVAKGFSEVSLREVAKHANVAPGTAYKYFPDREQLVRAFFELKVLDAEATLEDIHGFGEFSFKEKLHTLLGALLDEFLPDREFVAVAMRGLVDAPLQSFGAMQPVRRKLIEVVGGMLDTAVANNEFPPLQYRSFITNAFWDYTVLVVLYWLNDDSEYLVKSTEFIDKSLDVYVALVRSGLVDQAARLGLFLLKNHLYANFEHVIALFGAMSELSTGATRGKR